MKSVQTVPARPAAEWQRARRPEQKAERRDAIVAGALSLLDEEGVEGTTLSEIARRAGVSKANCYRYFESREAILLAVAIDEARGWAAELANRLGPLPARATSTPWRRPLLAPPPNTRGCAC